MKSTRFHERTKLAIPLEVIYNENAEIAWREITRTDEVTICGGGFTISRPIEPKRLVHLKMLLPKQFRLFDYGKTHYDIWGLVRYVRLVDSSVPNRICLKVGAALVGNHPPKSFVQDPTTHYDLKPILRNQSLWELRELPRHTGPYVRSAEDRRQFNVSMLLENISDDGQITETVLAETQNISESGMAVTARITTAQPRYVVVKTLSQNLRLLAKVRGVHPTDDERIRRLHLEFISGKWFV